MSTLSGRAFRRAVSNRLRSFAGVDDGRAGLGWGGGDQQRRAPVGHARQRRAWRLANLSAPRLVGHNVADNDPPPAGPERVCARTGNL
ncbi:BCSC C-terminal domain-containing protein [Xanthomonas cerealis pv. cerealis]|uniref:cellulose synthase subunit BcsC-related outer membrane protein n=1 Tax=Xanthomonas cerealis TaxID=3390025 RepID=UPI0039758ED8|nr:BCSC C-terminal domain-containing protein [Xanthomonas translucens pv. pistacia]